MNNNPSSDGPDVLRRLLTRAEACTLIGMVLAVFSLLLPWEHIATPRQIVPAAALFANFQPITHTGFHTAAHNPVLLGAFLSGAMLLFTPKPGHRLPFVFVQCLCSLIVFVAALRWFNLAGYAFLSGVVLGLAGSVLLTFGALDRLAAPPLSEKPS